MKLNFFYEHQGLLDQESLHGVAVLETQFKAQQQRPPCDIVCCIDKSGSMDGAKLNQTKQALKILMRHLQHADSLCIITFDSHASVDFALAAMNDEAKQEANKAIDKIEAGSSTNMAAGLLCALEQVKQGKNPIATILFLTDGVANVGTVATTKLQHQILGAWKKLNKPLCTMNMFGLEKEHDPKLLCCLARETGGMYYFVPHEDDIAPSFDMCMIHALQICAHQVVLELQHPHASLSVLTAGCQVKQVDCSTTRVHMGNMLHNDTRTVLVQLANQCGNTVPSPLTCIVHYVDIFSQEWKQVSHACPLSIVHNSKQEPNPLITQQLKRCQLLQALQKATEQVENVDAAKSILQQAQKLLAPDDKDDDFDMAIRNEIESIVSTTSVNFHATLQQHCLSNCLERKTSKKSTLQDKYYGKRLIAQQRNSNRIHKVTRNRQAIMNASNVQAYMDSNGS